MKFFKVKPEYDQTKIATNRILVKNELYTFRQLGKMSMNCKKFFDEVEINRNDTYWFFGARFSKQHPYNTQ